MIRVAERRVAMSPFRSLSNVLLCAALFAGCGADEVSVRSPGHQRMVAALGAIRDRTAEEHPYLGVSQVQELRAAVAGGARDWRTRLELGRAELRLGREREGIRILDEVLTDLREERVAGDTNALAAVLFHLGVASMRLAETENCCAEPSPESCILPFVGSAVHGRPEGATRAMACFEELAVLARGDDYWHNTAIWLLNLAALALGTWPDAVAADLRLPAARLQPDPARAFPRFVNVAGAVGLDTFSLSGGAVADDFDLDGRIDLLVSTWDPLESPRLWLQGDDGRFAEPSGRAGLAGRGGGLNMVQADYDGDGDVDVLVLRGAWLHEFGRHPNSLLRNEGGTFVDVTFEAGLGDVHYPTQTAAFADYDLDGDLDIYIGNESSSRCEAPSQLFRNEGNGKFVDVAAAAGVTNLRYAKAVSFGDYDGDGDPDLFVSNLGAANRLYRNDGDGTFVDVARDAGVTEPIQSFPAWFWDFDNDGHLDLFVSSYDTAVGHVAAWHRGEPVTCGFARLYRGDGRGRFVDVAEDVGLRYPAMPMGANFGDVDGDGWLDLYLGTGDTTYASLMPNVMFVNRGGRGFVDVTLEGGFGHLQKGHAVAFADFDSDGDLDVFEQMGGALRGDGFRDALYENPGFGSAWIELELVGRGLNRSAIGARVRIDVAGPDGPRTLHREVGSGGSFGANPLRMHVGLGSATDVQAVEIRWPGAARPQRLDGPPIRRSLRIVEGQPGFEDRTRTPVRLGAR
ncbi:MAG: CRTAC1 family protein [Planctomycetota bacterium]